METRESKPSCVVAAMQRGDREALSAMGRAGGHASHRYRRTKHAQRELEDEAFSVISAERHARDELLRQQSANEHIIPLDEYE